MNTEMIFKRSNKLDRSAVMAFAFTILVVCQAQNALAQTNGSLGKLVFKPSSQSFGSVLVGTKNSRNVTLTNIGGTSVSVSKATVDGSYLTLNGKTPPFNLAASQSVTLTVIFAPQSAGSVSGSVRVASNASNPSLTLPVSGTAVAPGLLTSTPSSLSFGNVTVGNTSSLRSTITNAGGTSVTISQIGVSGPGFSVSGITTPLTLAPSQSATFTVTFAPQYGGNLTGRVTVSSNASNPSLALPLSGTAIPLGLLTATPSSLSFGSVTVGNSSSLSSTITNTGGTNAVISQIAVTGSGFSVSGITTPLTLAPSQNATFTVTFAPHYGGAITGRVSITSNASNQSLGLPLSGTAVPLGLLTATPTTLGFGNVAVGNSSSLSSSITNVGGTGVLISQIGVTGSGFSVNGITTPITLAPSQSATLTVTFAPHSTGYVSGSVTITSNAANPSVTLHLSGTAYPPGILTANPASIGFGNVVVGSSGTASGTLTATVASVTVNSVVTSNSVFSIGGLSLPISLSAGQSMPFTITFSPLVTGTVNATLSITSNAQTTVITVPLTGSGTTPSTHNVNLAWEPGTSPNVVGYNVYRAIYSNNCGTLTKINTLLNVGTLYTDSTVTDGMSYCYAATAVDSSNIESGYSNIVSNLQIPVP